MKVRGNSAALYGSESANSVLGSRKPTYLGIELRGNSAASHFDNIIGIAASLWNAKENISMYGIVSASKW